MFFIWRIVSGAYVAGSPKPRAMSRMKYVRSPMSRNIAAPDRVTRRKNRMDVR
jgi:hypothetical protein